MISQNDTDGCVEDERQAEEAQEEAVGKAEKTQEKVWRWSDGGWVCIQSKAMPKRKHDAAEPKRRGDLVPHGTESKMRGVLVPPKKHKAA